MSEPLFTPEQVRAMDARAIAAGVDEAELMERAARHLVRHVVDLGGRGYGLRVGIVCGSGNNGGDGLALARLLSARGALASVAVAGGADRLDGLPARQRDRLLSAGGRVVAGFAEATAAADVVVDCLLGTGSRGDPRGPYRDAIGAVADARSAGARVLACDQPTGVDAATGAVTDLVVTADRTVVLGAEKLGLRLWPARGYCGRIVLGDIGIRAGDVGVARLMDDQTAASLLPPPPPTVHKRSRGVVVVLAGSRFMTGAPVLAARGAYGAGAGLVTVCTPEPARKIVAGAVPEALTCSIDAEDPDTAFETLAGHCERADAVALGPGLGTAPATVTLVRRVVREIELPMVVDADGCNAFAGASDLIADHRSSLLVLTPHAGEYARLASAPYAERATRLRDDAARWRAVVVAKGPGTLTVGADGNAWVNASGNVALATGGTGDVLTGMLGAILAGGATSDRVAAGVHLHGRAGEVAGRLGHVRSVVAGDLAAALPYAWGTVERGREGRA